MILKELLHSRGEPAGVYCRVADQVRLNLCKALSQTISGHISAAEEFRDVFQILLMSSFQF